MNFMLANEVSGLLKQDFNQNFPFLKCTVFKATCLNLLSIFFLVYSVTMATSILNGLFLYLVDNTCDLDPTVCMFFLIKHPQMGTIF